MGTKRCRESETKGSNKGWQRRHEETEKETQRETKDTMKTKETYSIIIILLIQRERERERERERKVASETMIWQMNRETTQTNGSRLGV